MKNRFSLLLLLLLTVTGPVLADPGVSFLGPYGGDVRSLAVHPDRPDRILLGTSDGQIYISNDRGATWSRSEGLKRRRLVIDSIVFHPANPDVIYVGGWELKRDRGELYRSTDGGGSWTLLPLGGEFNSSVRALAVSPVDPSLIAVGITEGVMLSRDGGVTWDRISRGFRSMHNVHSLVFDPFNRETLFVGTFRLGWRTDDLGRKWIPLTTGIYWDSDFFSIQVNPKDRENVIIGACSGFYRSTDQGESWNRIRNGLPEEAKRTRVVGFDTADPRTVFAGTTAGLFKSVDNGVSWKPILKDVIINSILVHPEDSSFLLAGTDDAGVMVSHDGGVTFNPSNQGFNHRQISALERKEGNPSEIIYLSVTMDREYGGFFFSRDGGNEWIQFNEGLDDAAPWISSILPSRKSDRVFLGTSRGIYSGVPGSSAWKEYQSTSRLKINQIAYADPEERKILIAAEEGLFRLNPDNDTILKLKTGIIYNEGVSSVITTTGRSFAGTGMGVFTSTDKGDSWTIFTEGLPYLAVNSFTAFGSDLYCATEKGIYRLDLAGSAWEPVSPDFNRDLSVISSGLPASLFTVDLANGYFYFSRDRGGNWDSFDLERMISAISCLKAEADDQVLVGTVSEGLVRIRLSGTE